MNPSEARLRFPISLGKIRCKHQRIQPIEAKTMLRAYCLDCGVLLYKKGRCHGGRRETKMQVYKCQRVRRDEDGVRRYLCQWAAVWWSGSNAFCPLHIPKKGGWVDEEARRKEMVLRDEVARRMQEQIEEETRIIREAGLEGDCPSELEISANDGDWEEVEPALDHRSLVF